MIILCEKSNALWHPLLTSGAYRTLDEAFDAVLGLGSRRKVESLRKKANPRLNVNLETWSQHITKALNIAERRDLFSEDVRASTFAELLGVGPFGQRYLFDVFYSDLNKSSFSSLVFDARKAEQIARTYCGEYLIEFVCEGSKLQDRGRLDIRYFIPVGLDSIHSKHFKIRCKLDLPKVIETEIQAGVEMFEYDGFLSLSTNSLSFQFESRVDAWETRSLMLLFPNYASNGNLHGRFLKTPFGATSHGLSGSVTMQLVSRHDCIIMPHSNLQEVG